MQDYYEIRRSESYAAVELKLFLEQLKKQGAKIYLDGDETDCFDAAARLVREKNRYMADYILGENGKIEQVRYDSVSTW